MDHTACRCLLALHAIVLNWFQNAPLLQSSATVIVHTAKRANTNPPYFGLLDASHCGNQRLPARHSTTIKHTTSGRAKLIHRFVREWITTVKSLLAVARSLSPSPLGPVRTARRTVGRRSGLPAFRRLRRDGQALGEDKPSSRGFKLARKVSANDPAPARPARSRTPRAKCKRRSGRREAEKFMTAPTAPSLGTKKAASQATPIRPVRAVSTSICQSAGRRRWSGSMPAPPPIAASKWF